MRSEYRRTAWFTALFRLPSDEGVKQATFHHIFGGGISFKTFQGDNFKSIVTLDDDNKSVHDVLTDITESALFQEALVGNINSQYSNKSLAIATVSPY